MLAKRIMTAAVALPVPVTVLVFGPSWVVALFLLVTVGLCTFEAGSMLYPKVIEIVCPGASKPESERSRQHWIVWLAVLVAVGMFITVSSDTLGAGRGIVIAGLMSCFLFGAFLASDNQTAFARLVVLLVAVTYGSFPWLSAWELYVLGQGPKFLFLLIVIVWSGDTGAYFGGKYWGRRKLAPRMSPNKTQEGAFVGIVASMVGAFALNIVYGGGLGSIQTVLLAAFLGGSFGQMGDLVESTLKRFAGVKDSGFIFPGHGGILDRVDGVMFAAPVVWFTLYLGTLIG